MQKEESNIWEPESKIGYVKLFYFGILTGVICVGGNIAIHSLWISMVKSAEIF